MSLLFWKHADPADTDDTHEPARAVNEQHPLPVGVYVGNGEDYEEVGSLNPLPVEVVSSSVSSTPALFDITRLVYDNRVWRVTETATTTAVAAMPTTTAGVTLQNKNGSQTIIVILGAFVHLDVLDAALDKFGLIESVHRATFANVTADIASTAYHATKAGQGTYAGNALFDLGATVVDDGWHILTPTVANVKNSAIWDHVVYKFDFPTILPAGCGASYELVSSDATVEGAIGLVFAEGTAAQLGLA